MSAILIEFESLLMVSNYVEGMISKMTNIYTPRTPSLASKRAQRTSSGRRLPAVLTGRVDRKFSAASPPSGGTASPPLPLNRRFIFPILAVLAALAFSLLFLVPGGPAQADDPVTHEPEIDHVHYAEKGTGPVRAFTAPDPEEHGIQWSIRGLDAADFEISSNGVLTFKNSPDYENPTDRELQLDADDAISETPADRNLDDDATPTTYPLMNREYSGTDNEYQITVSATEMSGKLPQKRTDLDFTVIIRNVEEPGTISFDTLLPEVGTEMRATLTEPDNADPGASPAVTDPVTDGDWTWYTSKVADPDLHTAEHWTEVPAASVAEMDTPTEDYSTYTPRGKRVNTAENQTVIDEGRHIRVRVDYTDRNGSDTAYEMTIRPVRAEVSSENDGVASPWDNGSPDFVKLSEEISVDEDTAVGMAVGASFQAVEPDPEDVLYYSVHEDTANAGDHESFDIDPATGQVTVAKALDHEEGDGEYVFTVRAKDPSGEFDDIEVTVTATDVDEGPTLNGRAELMVLEGIYPEAMEGGTFDYDSLPVTGTGPNPRNNNEYTVDEPDRRDSISGWDLEGDDEALFDLEGQTGFEPRRILFKQGQEPDFENPTDKNKDNVYEVTIVAVDAAGNRGTLDVAIVVRNRGETGWLVFTEGEVNDQAYYNEALVAQVYDPDDHGGDLGEPYEGVNVVTSMWERAEALEAVTVENLTFVIIEGETTDSYTPVPEDHGYYLRATVTYIDPISNTDNNLAVNVAGDRVNDIVDSRITGDDGEGHATPNSSLRTVMLVTKNAVRRPVAGATIPRFVDLAGDTITSVSRQVQENTDLTTPVDSAGSISVEIDEPDVTLLWTVSGAHADNFRIIHPEVDGSDDTSVGDINVIQEDGAGKTAPEFDFDDRSKPNPYRIRLNVRVQGGETDQIADIDVAIHVTNIDEDITVVRKGGDDPELITAPGAAGSDWATDPDPVPAGLIHYPEVKDGVPNKDAVATFMATDPEGARIRWDLKGADAGLFTISAAGVLEFNSSPDYEDPKDRVAATGADPAVTDYLLTTPNSVVENRRYDLVLRAIEDRSNRPSAERSWPAPTAERRVTVVVDNVDEPGVITLQWRQPELGTPIMATLRDPDGPESGTEITVAAWEWKISNAGIVPPMLDKDNPNHWRNALGSGNSEAGYTPTDGPYQPGDGDVVDLGRYLWAQASYTDAEGVDKTAIGVSEMTVQAADLGEVDGSPNFQRDLEEISVGENTPSVGTLLGTVAVRQGGMAAGDTLTYSFRDVIVTDLTTAVTNALGSGDETRIRAAITNNTWGDDEFFTINRANGQIRLAQPLDFESRPPGGKYIVVVRAADPSVDLTVDSLTGLDDVVVIITATDENDAPKLTGRVELSIDENAAVNAFAGNTPDILEAIEAVIDGTADQAEQTLEATAVNRYTFSDPDAQDGFKQWNLAGPDGDSFRLVQTVGRLLEFKESPNYENPADADGDNVYKVTMWTIDNDGARFELNICVTVQNVNEAGEVTLYDSNNVELDQPYENQTVRAEVTDPDGGFRLRHEVVQVVNSWAWHRHQNPPSAADESAWGDEIGERSMYTPEAGDIGWFLRATAMYVDNAPDRPAHENGVYTARAVTKHAVLQVDQNRSPEFPVESVTRYIAENSPTTTHVDVPLPLATDPDGGMLTYVLTDDNNGLFQLVMVDGDGVPMDGGTVLPMKSMTPVLQVRVAPLALATGDFEGNFGTEFNRENEDLNSYVVIVTVSDDGGHKDTLTVNIMVTDRNEAPPVPSEAPPGPSISGRDSVDVMEGHTGMVETYMVVRSDETVTWTLTGADTSDFTLDRSTGELNFRTTPDFENAADADQDNTYEIAVNAAIAGGDPLSIDVTITVTNADELGTVSGDVTAEYAENGMDAVATYTADGPVSAAWSVSGADMDDFRISNEGVLSFASAPDFEGPADADTDNVYMVTVEANAGGEMGEVAVTITVTNVDEDGTVTLSSMTPVVDAMLTATLSDPDGGVTGETWQWSKSMDMSSWMDIAGATSMSYTPVAEDEGYYLRAMVTYTDAHGLGKMAMATTTAAVTTGDPLVNRYDANGDGEIQKSEVIAAINDYLFGTGSDVPTKDEVIRLINLYLFG